MNEVYRIIGLKLTGWLHNFIRMLPDIFFASIILVFGFFIAKRLSKFILKMVTRISSNITMNNLIGSIIHIFLVCITIFTALSILKLDKAVMSILAGAGIIGLALAFAFQDIAANFICGIFISFRKPLHIGDIVNVKDYMGKVEEINLRDTVLRTFQGQIVIIPNKEVFQNPIENFSLPGKRRIDLSVGVSYGDDLEKVRKIAIDAVKNIEHLSDEDEITLFFREFGDSSINFLIRMWIKSPEQIDYLNGCSEAIICIKKAFDTNDIMIPIPISTLDFGIEGGKTLKEMLS